MHDYYYYFYVKTTRRYKLVLKIIIFIVTTLIIFFYSVGRDKFEKFASKLNQTTIVTTAESFIRIYQLGKNYTAARFDFIRAHRQIVDSWKRTERLDADVHLQARVPIQSTFFLHAHTSHGSIIIIIIIAFRSP